MPVPGSEKQLVGHRVLRPLEQWLRVLHRQPAHGNRSLLADHVLIAHLVAFLSPALTSLRRIEEVFNHSAARRRFGLPEVPRSTLSDAQAVFDPALLDPIVADLRDRVPVLPHDPEPDALLNTLTAVDGSFFALAPRVSWALYNKPKAGPVKKRVADRRGSLAPRPRRLAVRACHPSPETCRGLQEGRPSISNHSQGPPRRSELKIPDSIGVSAGRSHCCGRPPYCPFPP